MAPSPMNAQPWDFIVITNQETKKTIFAETEKLWSEFVLKERLEMVREQENITSIFCSLLQYSWL